jgi:hypothetical protein
MSEIIRQSTARSVIVGPILDADGVAVTDAVISNLKISKNGAAPAALNGSATLTHRHTGHYSLALTTSDTDTVGTAQITIDDTVNSMPPKELTVIEEAVYDALYAASATGLLPANVTQIGGDSQSATDLKDFADAGYDPSTNKVQGVVLVDTLTTYTGNTPQTGDSYAIVNSGTHGNAAIKAETASILADTNELQTDWANGGRLDLILDARASQTSVDDLPTNAELATALTNLDAAVSTRAPAATALSTAQWTNARAGYLDNINNATLAGASFPTDPADQSLVIAATDAITAAIAALNNLDAAGVRAAVGLAAANLDTQLADLPTASENATALLDLAAGVETGLTLRQALRLIAAAAAGKISGAATTTIVIRNAVADSKDRITATVDADGNRSAITVDLT